jgi:hypothetical protein
MKKDKNASWFWLGFGFVLLSLSPCFAPLALAI